MAKLEKAHWVSYATLMLLTPAHSLEWGSHEWFRRMKEFVPAQQSECEISSNKAMLAHPRTDIFEFMERYHSFYFGPAPPPVAPFSYRDAASKIIFYVESDGRHITALDAGGKLLWVRNPFVDSNMCPYRSAHPYIVKLGPAEPIRKGPDINAGIREELESEFKRGRKGEHPHNGDEFISLTFNSSNFGYLNIRTGDYYDMGQN